MEMLWISQMLKTAMSGRPFGTFMSVDKTGAN